MLTLKRNHVQMSLLTFSVFPLTKYWFGLFWDYYVTCFSRFAQFCSHDKTGQDSGGQGSIRQAGGAFAKMEIAHEEEYFYKLVSFTLRFNEMASFFIQVFIVLASRSVALAEGKATKRTPISWKFN